MMREMPELSPRNGLRGLASSVLTEEFLRCHNGRPQARPQGIFTSTLR